MDTRTLSYSPTIAQPLVHPPDSGTASTRAAETTSVRPSGIEHNATPQAFFTGEQVRPLSETERGHVVTALKTGIDWLKRAISSLSKPPTEDQKPLLNELVPGGLQSQQDRDAFKQQLIHTEEGMQQMVDNQAAHVYASVDMPVYNALTNRKTGEMHISSDRLSQGGDTGLAASLVHEASHAYADTKDNWTLAPHEPTKWDSFKSLFASTTPKFDRGAAPGLKEESYDFSNATHNAYTVQYATEVLAGRPYDSLE